MESTSYAPDQDFVRPNTGVVPSSRQKPTEIATSNSNTGGEASETLLTPERDSLGQYLYEIAQGPLLTAKEEVELQKNIEAGLFAEKLLVAREKKHSDDPEITEEVLEKYKHVSYEELAEIARLGQDSYEKFIIANTRLVVSQAKKFRNRVSLLDNIQEGNLGLIRAVEKFDYTKGFKFSTYATWWIRQAIARGAADTGRTIRLPSHRGDLVNKVARVRREMTAKLDREPTDDELADALGMKRGQLEQLMRDAREPLSVDEPVMDGSTTIIGDLIVVEEGSADEGVVNRLFLRRVLDAIREQLTEREYDVLARRSGLNGHAPEKLDTIARDWGVTRARIQQIESVARDKAARATRGDA